MVMRQNWCWTFILGLDVLGHDLARPLLVCPDSRAALLGRGHFFEELFPAGVRVITSLPRLPVPLDVSTLRAVTVIMVKSADIGGIDAELP